MKCSECDDCGEIQGIPVCAYESEKRIEVPQIEDINITPDWCPKKKVKGW